MISTSTIAALVLLFGAIAPATACTDTKVDDTAWPAPTLTSHPWTRWWWLGSAVDRENISHLLQTYKAAGLGGVEITPIYGVQGQESRDIPYLSDAWMEMLKHTLQEANRLGMGVDMPTGTGWPFGGPQISAEAAGTEFADKFSIEKQSAEPGVSISIPASALASLAVNTVTGEERSLAPGSHFAAPDSHWKLYTLSQKWSGMKVKRAAPGGAGPCINPFLENSLNAYLSSFTPRLTSMLPLKLRAQFHDSFEYAANWSPDLLKQFSQDHGYRLEEHLPAFFGDAPEETHARVRTDYRDTAAQMLLNNFTLPWTKWAHSVGSISRNQAHGSPGNLLDLYGAVDIPETEVFRSKGDPRVSKFASSAAHVMGHNLVSSETCTWMAEHFNETLAEARQTIDRLFVSGINHIFYHGTAYSPADAAWPGWMFYASTHFEPNNPIWRDFHALNAYAARSQSLLQQGKEDNDLLVYWPLSDLWQNRPALFGLTIESKWLEGEAFGDTAQHLWDRGWCFDYVSDAQLLRATASDGFIHLPGGSYRAVLVPPCRYMPETTLQQLLTLARAGCRILFQKLPEDVPGLGRLQERRRAFAEALDGVRKLSGRAVVSSDLDALLAASGAEREPASDRGLMLVRRQTDSGKQYLVVNQSRADYEGWLPLSGSFGSAVMYDARTGESGTTAVRQLGNVCSVFVQIPVGQARIIRTSRAAHLRGAAWSYWRSGPPTTLSGVWKLTFATGGPELPAPQILARPYFWTGPEVATEATLRFGGTARYSTQFSRPKGDAKAYVLDLGDVRESAKVTLNGRQLGVLIDAPYRLTIPASLLKQKGNVLEIEITGTAANRIRDMDIKKIPWRIFHEINFVNIDYKPFDSSSWAIRPCGLNGPVTIAPAEVLKPE